jgi:hypothetical protein
MARLCVRCCVRALALVSLTAAVYAAAAGAQTRSTVFTDPTGDGGTAADVTTVLVTNDSAGNVTFQIKAAAPYTSTQTLDILVDSDLNGSTGDPNAGGAEYDLYQQFSDHTWDLQVWNGSGWSEAPSSQTVHVSYTADQLTFQVNRSELGNTGAFNFWIDSCDADCSAGHEDQAPASGLWNYQLSSSSSGGQTLHLSMLALLAPGTGKAGRDYSAAAIVERSDTNGFLTEGTVSCKATIGGRAGPRGVGEVITVTYQGSKVSASVCTGHLPKSAAGKTMKGTVTVSYQGATVTRSFTAHVH